MLFYQEIYLKLNLLKLSNMRVILLILFVFNIFDVKNIINSTNLNLIKNLQYSIDSLHQEFKLNYLWDKIIKIESNNGLYVYNEKENAIGIAQIRPIMIREVNRLLGENKYSHEQAWDDSLSFCIFKDYQDKVNPSYDLEIGSRLWNGGISGMNKQSTIKYYQKILSL